MHEREPSIFEEPATIDPHTLAHLGPLAPLAGIWEGTSGRDRHPVAEGEGQDGFEERYELQPIDPQTNGPQLLYGLRYHTHIRRPGAAATFHDQVGYWLYEPATETVMLTLTIPRGQVAMAAGQARRDARAFEVVSVAGSPAWGICSNPFLLQSFKTEEFRMKVTVHDDGTWTYEQDTVLRIRGRAEPFHHTDRNTLRRIAAPTPNPLALAAG
jgi:hypothetical protein